MAFISSISALTPLMRNCSSPPPDNPISLFMGFTKMRGSISSCNRFTPFVEVFICLSDGKTSLRSARLIWLEPVIVTPSSAIEALSNTIGPRSVWRFTPLRVMYPVLYPMQERTSL